MLLKFYCSNYKSIKDEVEFNMFAGSYKRHESHLIPFRDKSILRTAAIYGTNGSGKTNLLLALQLLHRLIIVGTKDINEVINIPVFKLSDCKNIPTKFDIDFIIENRRFNYQLDILNNIIIREELFEITIENSEVIIFKRKFQGKKTSLTIAPNRDKNQKEKLREEIYSEELRENQTFFKEAINKKLNDVQLPFEWFSKQLKFVSLEELISNSHSNYTTHGLASTFMLDKDFLSVSKSIISKANVGILDFKIVEISLTDLKAKGLKLPPFIETDLLTQANFGIDVTHEGELYSSFKKDDEIKFVKISTLHKDSSGNEVEFKFSEESKGVQRLFELLPAIYRSIHKGEIFVVDEIETSFHPVLIREILSLYLDTIPNSSGQIIFTTHESHLLDLDLFRQDEIWFCEKDKNGATRLYSLSEFKPRFDKDIRKGYLEGQFGFIPFLGDINNLGI
ncbi:MAG: ATP-binding protein [Bacteroidota bacterium]